MSKALSAILVLIPVLAWADQPRGRYEFVSDNGRFVVVSTHGSVRRVPMFENGRFKEIAKIRGGADATWGLFDAHQAEPLEDLPGLEITWSPVYSFKGDFSSRTMFVGDDGETVIVVDDFSEREPSEDLEVLHFFNEGRLTRVYTLGELFDDIGRVRPTASHFLWISSRSLRYEDDLLHLVTTECRRLEFDGRKGETVSDRLVFDDAGDCMH